VPTQVNGSMIKLLQQTLIQYTYRDLQILFPKNSDSHCVNYRDRKFGPCRYQRKNWF